ncbi:hypothetical protein OESDEN_13169, partial [Oesophagostomum dentatum]
MTSKQKDRIGTRMHQAKLLGGTTPALLDTGSMISIVPLDVLVRAYNRGFDIDSIEPIPKEEIDPVFDASNNPMSFLGAGNEIEQRTQKGEIKVARRVYIPPHQSMLVPVRCDPIDNDVEVVLWPTKLGVPAGVFKITHQETLLPVTNVQNEPLLLKEGESVGRVGSERWKENWEDLDPLVLAQVQENFTEQERVELLMQLIGSNMKSTSIDHDLRSLLEEFCDAFAVSDNELIRTDL